MTLRQIETIAELRPQVAQWRRRGERIALVPTMGNLHAGHLELVRKAQVDAARVIVSIFVNPTQFGVNEDFGRYPRSIAADLAALESVQADAVFLPSVETMYPLGQHGVRIEVPELSDLLCGQHRPGHFAGVATVVGLLFNLVQPDVAVFGEKDYQQLAVIRRMVTALGFPLDIIGVPTQREVTGLALSSRNQYLSVTDREIAPRIYQTLQQTAAQLQAGQDDFAGLEATGCTQLIDAGFDVDYYRICTPELQPPAANSARLVVLTAARLGTTRLIDNISVQRFLR